MAGITSSIIIIIITVYKAGVGLHSDKEPYYVRVLGSE